MGDTNHIHNWVKVTQLFPLNESEIRFTSLTPNADYCTNWDIMAKRNTSSPIADPLLKAIADSGMNRLQLSIATGVSRQSLIRLERGDNVRCDVLEKLATYFKLELKPTKGKK